MLFWWLGLVPRKLLRLYGFCHGDESTAPWFSRRGFVAVDP
jgi:hypothetical protein